jgi:hypothetical protein
VREEIRLLMIDEENYAEIGLHCRVTRKVWGLQYVVSFVSAVCRPEVIIA